jgi:tetratricopeptide (TPR) repeat protein
MANVTNMSDKVTKNMQSRLNQVFEAIDDQQFRVAKQLIKKAVNKYPRHPIAYVMQGYQRFLIEDDYADAYLFFKEAIYLGHQDAYVFYNLGLCAQEMGNKGASMNAFFKACQLANTEQKFQFKELVAEIESIIHDMPSNVSPEKYFENWEFYDKANIHMVAERFEKATPLLEKILSVQTDNAEALELLCTAYMYLKDYPQARHYLTKLSEIMPNEPIVVMHEQMLSALEDGSVSALPPYSVFSDLGNGTNNPASQLNKEISEAIQGHNFETLEDVQAFANDFMNERNSQGIADFLDLSPTQMQDLMTAPLSSPKILAWHFDQSHDYAKLPFNYLATKLLATLNENKIKATSTGNLPRNMCRQIFVEYEQDIIIPSGNKAFMEANFNAEFNFHDLHIVRVLLDLCGYIKCTKSTWVLSKKGKSLANDIQNKQHLLFESLLKCYLNELNWAYPYGDEHSCGFLRQSIGFTLYLLHVKARSWTDGEDLSDWFFDAFPQLFEDENFHESLYVYKVFFDFAYQMGLLSKRTQKIEGGVVNEFKTTDFFKALIHWKI